VPELPEVETIARDLAPCLIGRTLKNPRLFKSNGLREVSTRKLLGTLRGATVHDVSRRAKHVVFLLDSGFRLVIQPRMTGTLSIAAGRPSAEERKYRVLQANIGEGKRFVYRDVRRLGTIWLLDERAWLSYTGRIGPEPLHESFGVREFEKQLKGTRTEIKKALMDQRRIAGVGNIYANEALFRAGIDPSRRTDRLSHAELAKLLREVRGVLDEAIDAKGTTLRDYRTGTGDAGSFQGTLQVYGRGGSPCVRCGATLATTHAIDGRATTFCYKCQASSK
jgi:formamidopyrimidine-DNA glycosylase